MRTLGPGDGRRVLNVPSQGPAVFFDALNFQRAIELENDGTRRIERHKRHVRTGAEHVLIGDDLGFDPVVRDIKAAGGLLRRGLLSLHCEGQRQHGQNRHNAGENMLHSFHGFMTTIIQSRGLDGKNSGALAKLTTDYAKIRVIGNGRPLDTTLPGIQSCHTVVVQKPSTETSPHLKSLFMRRGLSLSPLFVCALAVLSAQAGTSQRAVDFKETTLKNGLRVITVEDHSAPVVALSTYTSVRATPGRTGLPSFEHMSSRVPKCWIGEHSCSSSTTAET